MENRYLYDARYCLRRASRALSENMGRDALYDAGIYYAFGIEKLCKAVVYDVNPVFLYENPKLDNVGPILYPDRLLPNARKKLENDRNLNQNVIPFKLSVLLAAYFSQSIHDRIGEFTELADLRGCLAHRSADEVDSDSACRFMLRTFHPSLLALSEDLDFYFDDCFESEQKQQQLLDASDGIRQTEGFVAKMNELVEAAKKRWAERQKNNEAVALAMNQTRAEMGLRSGGPYTCSVRCPACSQSSVLYYGFLTKAIDDGFATYGSYAVGLLCHFCLLKLSGYAKIDYFKLNDLLAIGTRRGVRDEDLVTPSA